MNDLDIAIIGMACRFPGARSVETFWQNLRSGIESISFFSDAELLASGIDPASLANPHYVKAGTVLPDVDRFDAAFFDLTPREAEILDPQQRLLLECAQEALETAGYVPDGYPGAIGVYAGAGMNEYFLHNLSPNPTIAESVDAYSLMVSNDKDYLPTRLAYKLNLKGPGVGVQTACSTSLVAIHLACQSLLNGECHIALAGGVTIQVPQKRGYLYQQGMIVSPDGHCRAFDAKAQGTTGGNGAGIVVLKPLEAALADGDTIHAVIKGSAINNDGALKVGYTAPSVEGQAQVIREAQAVAGVEPQTITYIEAHGTATELGDPIEIAALTQAFQSRLSPDAATDPQPWCAIGSVKTNIGHADAAAGVAGFIKTVLALQHRQLPPSLHFESPNPNIDFANSPFYVNATLNAWPASGTPRRAGVSSFGIGGTNAHVVLEEAPTPPATSPSRPWQLLVLSAKTPSALDTTTAHLADHLEQHPQLDLADVAYTLHVGRQAYAHRRMVLAQATADAVTDLRTPERLLTDFHELCERPVAFMFSGQGAQYVNMAKDLYELEPSFRATVDRCAAQLEPDLGLDIRHLLYPDPHHMDEAAQQLNQTAMTQPALFVIEYALAQLWLSWGVWPHAMMGHSIGEYVAACLAGVFSLDDALATVAWRGHLMQSLPKGAMLAVTLPEAPLRLRLAAESLDLELAAVNGASLCVVSGREDTIHAFEQRLDQEGIICRRLHTSHAFHCAMMDPILERFRAHLGTLKLSPPQIPYISNLSGAWITAEEVTTPDYWTRHLRHTVRFADGLGTLLQEPDLILLEVGPGTTLAALTKQHSALHHQTVLTSLRHPNDTQHDVAFMLHTLGHFWVAGGHVDWSGFYAHERRQRQPLPAYPFERQRYWIEPQLEPTAPAAAGKKPDIADWIYMPLWKQTPPVVPHAAGEAPATGVWLVFVDACGLSVQLAERLRQAGHTVITVAMGETFAQSDATGYVLNPQQASDYETLIATLSRLGQRATAILYAWNVTRVDAAWRETLFARVAHAQQVGFTPLFDLMRALDKWDWTHDLRITVLSNHMHNILGDDGVCPEKALLLGWVRTMPYEYPAITCRSLDVVLPTSGTIQAHPLLDQLLAELSGGAHEAVVAYRHPHRWVQSAEPIHLAPAGSPARWRQHGVYLITGGLGGVGMALAAYLAEQVQARLILVGRSAFPQPSEWDAWLTTHAEDDDTSRHIRHLHAMEDQGAKVLVLRADAANQAQMETAISQAQAQYGPIHGVIHAAGVPGSGAMLRQHADTIASGLAAKVQGALVLDALFRDIPLDFMVYCSSVTAFSGAFGHSDYTAANAFLDALAHYKTAHEGQFTLSINWDRWQQIGMAVAVETQHERVTGAGETLMGMTVAEGTAVFERILRVGIGPQILVSIDDVQTWMQRPVHADRASTGPPDEPLDPSNTGAPAHLRPELHTSYLAPENPIEQTLTGFFQSLLGIEGIGIDDDFFELGGNSLLGIQIVSHIRDAFQISLSLQTLFDEPTVAGLANYIEISQRAAQGRPDDTPHRDETIEEGIL